jgi:hypothetical protein
MHPRGTPYGYEDSVRANEAGWAVWKPRPKSDGGDCASCGACAADIEDYKEGELLTAFSCLVCEEPGCEECMPCGRGCPCPSCEEAEDEE